MKSRETISFPVLALSSRCCNSIICNWFANQRASTRRPALAAAHTQVNQQVPSIPTMLPDFRPKFDFNNVIESCQKSTNGDESRIDGGSDSPTPNDDEVHSNSDGAEMSTFPHIKQVGEVRTSSVFVFHLAQLRSRQGAQHFN
ncbi:hypothetical protein Y032_0598g463 [Ancylostoma ceylanicum]|uniref:Homeobox domain-containing protein n=1 Tax=Ancylostoma ceylanicum TaxID=53326 RepID=A0A016WM97_9BILA|nr:hypothetical protein Y032_0598g463 [Ancylostoma ceylanicum]